MPPADVGAQARQFTFDTHGRLPVSHKVGSQFRRGRWVIVPGSLFPPNEVGEKGPEFRVGIIVDLTADGKVLVDFVDDQGFTYVSRVVVPYDKVRQACIEDVPSPRQPQDESQRRRWAALGYKRRDGK